MTTPEILSLVSSVFGIVGGTLSVFFSWKAAQAAKKAAAGSDVLARRLTNRGLFED